MTTRKKSWRKTVKTQKENSENQLEKETQLDTHKNPSVYKTLTATAGGATEPEKANSHIDIHIKTRDDNS